VDKLNVLVVSGIDLGRFYLEKIPAVDPRISLEVGVRQFIDELRRKDGKMRLADRLEAESRLWKDWEVYEGKGDIDTLLARAEVVFGRVALPNNLVSRAPRLKWIHIQGAGIDEFKATGMLESSVLVTNGKGTMATFIAEHVLAFIFTMAKNVPRLLKIKQNGKWERFKTMELEQRTVGIIGLGAIGSEVARLAKGVGMRVIATKRSTTRRETNVSGVDELYPRGDLIQLLSDSDFVVVTAPLTEETKGMIGERELRAMKSTAYLINVARGQIVDESALIKALKEEWIAGAGIDAFDIEPLPSDSEFWELPNTILSCHMSGNTIRSRDREMSLFCENLRRYLAGEQLLNVIDKQKSY
jgi:phosphoglycerate dehydrogenase-like enzyme